MTAVTRFAPSPTNHLHLGHAYSAWFAWTAAGTAAGGRFLLRIEDIDTLRCKPAFEAAILEDLAWLGLAWDGPVVRQSARLALYRDALGRLLDDRLAYPCFCSRSDIAREIAESGGAPHLDAMGAVLFRGTGGGLAPAAREDRAASGVPYAIRLDADAVLARHGPLCWTDDGESDAAGTHAVSAAVLGDVVIARRDVPASYHLAVAIDDAAQGVTLVTRGADLAPASHIHRMLQAALGLPVPTWRHHRLIAGADGHRLAKRNNPLTLRMIREGGASPAQVWARLGVADYPPPPV
ncbi:MAG: tRNA glutamyl-Q(34) synthetase GluQRS [Alphaproteobacteria bacterium]